MGCKAHYRYTPTAKQALADIKLLVVIFSMGLWQTHGPQRRIMSLAIRLWKTRWRLPALQTTHAGDIANWDVQHIYNMYLDGTQKGLYSNIHLDQGAVFVNADELHSGTDTTDGTTFANCLFNKRSGTGAANIAHMVISTSTPNNDLAGLNIAGNNFNGNTITNICFETTGSGLFLSHSKAHYAWFNSHSDGLGINVTDDGDSTQYLLPEVKRGAKLTIGGPTPEYTVAVEDASGNVLAVTAVGIRVREGNRVTLDIPLITGIDTTGMTGGDVVQIPLEFTAAYSAVGHVTLTNIGLGSHSQANLIVAPGTNFVVIRKTGDGLASASVTIADLTSGQAGLSSQISFYV